MIDISSVSTALTLVTDGSADLRDSDVSPVFLLALQATPSPAEVRLAESASALRTPRKSTRRCTENCLTTTASTGPAGSSPSAATATETTTVRSL